MRCKRCGAILRHFLIANGGKNYYRCDRGLGHVGIRKVGNTMVQFSSWFTPCNTIHDDKGQVVPDDTLLSFMVWDDNANRGRGAMVAELFKVGRQL